MLIDMHLHQDRHSFDSHVSLEDIIDEAIAKGLDGICITDHDNNKLKESIMEYDHRGLKVFVGCEILTTQGDILVLGVPEIPAYDPFDADTLLTPEQVLALVRQSGGIAIAAHPYRKNNRGLGDHIMEYAAGEALALTAVEGMNASTPEHLNVEAQQTAMRAGLSITGGSDAHFKERVGLMATYIPYEIETEQELMDAIRAGDCTPVYYEDGHYHRVFGDAEKTA